MARESLCRISGEPFRIEDGDLEFYRAASPSFAGNRIEIPLPTLSPLERARRRYSFRNLRNLYHRSCDLSRRKIISMYAPDSWHKVYHSDEWWSDRWDPRSYARGFDFNRPFFDQFSELFLAVPQIHAYVILSENCEYINGAANCKNCYLCFNLDYCDECHYVTSTTHAVSCIDCLNVSRSELCYECVDCQNCYGLSYSERCIGCSDSAFLSECRQCRNCIGCCNLVNQENCLFNRKVSPAEIAGARAEIESRRGRSAFSKKAAAHAATFPRRYYFGYANENFSGYNVHHIKNSHHCFESFEVENCKYCNYVFQANNCMDYDIFGDHSQWIYECIATGLNATNDLFCAGCWGGSANCMYCHTVSGCRDCFGCCALRQAQYCILNRQYTKEEYEQLVPRILEHMRRTGEWGEFFPTRISPFAYNETVAHEYFPLDQDAAEGRGYQWRRGAERSKPERTALPETANEASDEILTAVLGCSACGKGYRVIASELRSYQERSIPLPEYCPECRHTARRGRSVPYRLWESSCAKCSGPLQTAFDPQKIPKVYCETCYQDSVF